ncbi:conserved hypothetical protein [Anaeromyxobacter sp. K]|uniref:hypothetical protein n=1 Tax=Anaeromyxobacter sp. (strain K) TaxID=447217 RepID=UPI00015FA00E|nr:hypothetical protein [Anaeromyxobacter sp. K]ACG72417.1 conserved hypothetical protein [Anaeromyxobacter sp. K]
MTTLDPDRLLAMLRDPNVESQEIAALVGAPREEVGRAARLVLGLARAKPEEVATLPAPLALALSRAALAAPRADVLAALAGHASRDVAKEAKRGLHLLRIRGVQVPEPPRPAPPVAAPAPAEPPPPAYASAVDGRGERAVWLSRAVPGKGIEVGQAVISDERGLVELQVALLGRKEWRAFARGILDRGAAMGVGEIERARAHALVAEARARNEVTGQRVPEGSDLWLAQLGPAAPLPDPAARFPALPDAEEAAALEASGALHDLPLLRGWLADEGYLREVAARLDEVAVSPLYLDERQRAEQMARVLDEAVVRYLEPPRRALLAGRLYSVAEHLDAAGDAANARAAAAAARALVAGRPAGEIPFARRLLEKAFPPAAPAAAGPDAGAPPPGEAGSPLIVAPR